ncbi:MAG: FAD:protein FMN transferase [Synergistaceae bacterium]|jgi:thiamine biosynthesis lipoprotein|nr:FAD:protein FMN transferase [Synergistaceae bacterium]
MRRWRAKFIAMAAIAALAACCAVAWGVRENVRGGERVRKFSTEFFGTFDTVVTFTAFARDEAEFERFLGVVRGEMNRMSMLFDIYNSYDGLVNLKTINDSAGTAPLKVDSDILELIALAKEAHAETGGAVNVALGPVLAIWHDYRERAASGDVGPPPEAELRTSAAHTSIDDVEMDEENGTVFLRYPDMRLDVGAIAKGYAAQKAADRARALGLASGIINAGGNVVIIGPPLDGRDAWNIGVQAPEPDGASFLIDVLSLQGGSAVTSGNYQRYFISDGKVYHHIIDPKTLYPAENVKSVTVIHSDSATADILSTAAFILPPEEAYSLAARRGAEAIWITEDGAAVATPGYLKYSKQAKKPGRGGLKMIGQ